MSSHERLRAYLIHLGETYGAEAPASADDSPLLDLYEGALDSWSEYKYAQLRPQESAVVVPGQLLKTASLCFDRVWHAPVAEIGFAGDTLAEMCYTIEQVALTLMAAHEAHFEIKPKYVNELALSKTHFQWTRFEKILRSLADAPGGSQTFDELNRDFPTQIHPRWLSQQLSVKYSRPIVPVYDSNRSREAAYTAGSEEVVVTLLKNLQVASEDALDWQQVREFRSDTDTKRKYRKLIHWLDSSMIGKSQSFIEDEVGLRLEDYEFALKKHGIKTVTGALASILDWKGLAAGSASAIGVAALSGPLHGAFVGASIVLGKVAIQIAEAKLKLDEVKRGPNSEVAFIYEVERVRPKGFDTSATIELSDAFPNALLWTVMERPL